MNAAPHPLGYATAAAPCGTVLLSIVVMGCSVLMAPAFVAAQELTVEPADDACLSAEAVRERVVHWLHGHTIEHGLRVTVHASTTPVGFTLERPDGSIAERHFAALPADCRDRLNAMGLAIAIALEQPVQATPLTAHAPPPPPPPAPVVVPPSDVASADEIGRVDRLRMHLAAMLLLETLPVAAPALGLGIEAPVSSALRLSVSAVFAPNTDVPLGDATADALLVAGRALICGDLSATRLAVEACAGALAGVVLAGGVDHAQNRDVILASTAAIGRIALRWPRDSTLSGRLALDGTLNLVRPELVVQAAPALSSRPGWLGLAGAVEAVITF